MKNNKAMKVQRTINFVDADKQKFEIEINLTEDGRFSMMGTGGNSSGQCYDSIKPSNEPQRELVKMWKEYHLNDMNAGTPKQTEYLKDFKGDYTEACKHLAQFNRVKNEAEHHQGLFERLTAIIEENKQEIKIIDKWSETDEEGKTGAYYITEREKYLTALNFAQARLENTLLYDVLTDGTLYRYGSAWLKNELPVDIEEQIENVCEAIEEGEQEREAQGADLSAMSDDELIEAIEQETGFTGRDAELCAAFVKMFDLCFDDLSSVEIDENRCTVNGTDYTAGTDDECDEALIEECKQSAWAFNANFLANYTDLPEEVFTALQPQCENANEAIIALIEKGGSMSDFAQEAASADGRGHFLNRYDGGEEEATVNGTTYYAYQN